jgi:CheY-like chemotaxis protein
MAELGGKPVILVADDEAVVRNLVNTVLTHAGYDVLIAADGAEALRVSRAHNGAIDLLLTDMYMPFMEGPEVAQAILQERPGVRVLLMTGHTERLTEPQQITVLRKPFRPTELVQRIANALAEPS